MLLRFAMLFWMLLCLGVPVFSNEFYVTPSHPPNPACPTDKPCQTLDEYAVYSDKYFGNESEVSLVFLNGVADYYLNTHDFTITEKVKFVMRTMYIFDTASICTTQQRGFLFNNVTSIRMTNILITCEEELENTTCFQVIGGETLVGLNIALNSRALLSGVRYISLKESLFEENPLKIEMITTAFIKQREPVPTAPSISITGCTLHSISIRVQHLLNCSILLEDNTVPIGITMSGIGVSVFLKGSYVNLNVYDCDISYYSDTGISIRLDSNSFLQAHLKNTNISHSPVGFEMSAFGSNFSLVFDNCLLSNNGNGAVHVVTDGRSLSTLHSNIIRTCSFQDRESQSISSVSFTGSTFTNNGGGLGLGTSTKGLIETIINNCTFLGNPGTAFKQTYGTLYLIGQNIFANNTGYQGGALSLINAQLCFVNNSTTLFNNNFASDVGGAMYIEPLDLPIEPAECFYQVPTVDDIQKLNIELIFLYNKAARGGDHIYGAAVHDTCIIDRPQNRTPTPSINASQQLFSFDQSSHLSRISSSPKRVCLCNLKGEPECASLKYIDHTTKDLYPGEELKLSVTVVGFEFGALSSVVLASAGSEDIVLGSHETSQLNKHPNCTEITYTAYPPLHNLDNLCPVIILNAEEEHYNTYYSSLAIQNDIDIYNASGYIPQTLLTAGVVISFSFLQCPIGFALIGTPYSCDCTQFFSDNKIVHCSIQNHSKEIYRVGSQWIGTFEHNTTKCTLITQHCPPNYCRQTRIPVDLDNPDVQCDNGRSGILCGTCMANFSRVLGSTVCQYCSNNYLALLFAFSFAGIALVLIIKILELTVAIGTVNGLVFYANIIWAHQNMIAPVDKSPSGIGQFLKVFIAWLNLDLGITTCLFDGLDAYWKTWLQFVFPLYMWTIAGGIIVASHLSFRVSRYFGNSTIHLLATLFLLSFSKILQTIITAVSFTFLYYPGGYIVVWTEDGTVSYLDSAQSILFAVALLVLALLWAPFMITLLFIQPLRKVDHYRPFRWINKWKPLFDAYTGPLKDKFHYWTGILLLARAVITVTCATTNSRTSVLVASITTSILILHTNMYKEWYVSLLEKSFLLNASILLISIIYVDQDTEATVVTVSLGVAFIQFGAIVFAHSVWQAKKWWRKRKDGQARIRQFVAIAVNHDDEYYREPLLGSGRMHYQNM